MIPLLVVRALASILAPIAINRLLAYMEDGSEAMVRPWVWILAILLGPLVQSLTWQYYGYIGTNVMIRIEAIVTELVFEHSLKIRVLDDSAPTDDPSSTRETKKEGHGANLVGKITNLVSTDLGNLGEGESNTVS